MSLETWLSFCVMEILLCLSPGPAVVFTTATALRRGARAALAGIGGILIANTLYFLGSATGVAAVLVTSGSLFTGLRVAGGLYLIWMGLRMLWRRAPARERPQRPAPRGRAVLLQGFLVQSSNPKALVYFIALLPQFIDPAGAVLPQLGILGLTSAIIEFSVLAFYTWLARRTHRYLGAGGSGLFSRLAGAFMLYIGARLALLHEF